MQDKKLYLNWTSREKKKYPSDSINFITATSDPKTDPTINTAPSLLNYTKSTNLMATEGVFWKTIVRVATDLSLDTDLLVLFYLFRMFKKRHGKNVGQVFD